MYGPEPARAGHAIPVDRNLSPLAELVSEAGQAYIEREAAPIVLQLRSQVDDPIAIDAVTRLGRQINQLPGQWAAQMAKHEDNPDLEGEARVSHLMVPFGQGHEPIRQTIQTIEERGDSTVRAQVQALTEVLFDNEQLMNGVLDPAVQTGQEIEQMRTHL